MQIADLAQFLVGKKIVQGELPWIARMARSQLQTRLARGPGSWKLDAQLRCQPDQFLLHLNHCHRRRRQPQARRHPGTEHLVHQNPAMLRVILELDHIVVAVRAAHQVRLRSPAHAPYVLGASNMFCYRSATYLYRELIPGLTAVFVPVSDSVLSAFGSRMDQATHQRGVRVPPASVARFFAGFFTFRQKKAPRHFAERPFVILVRCVGGTDLS